MLDTTELILKVSFFILTIIWIGKIMILRTDKQIVINPLLIGISAILVVLPESNELNNTSITIQKIKIMLYILYCLVVLFGVYSTRRKSNIF
ncbi:MAG: hypothetical protein E6X43_14710 [Peptostreptococcaceae bacterium]|nr:hypothetical protein [Peptostreptococcaceae bacterium]